VFLTKDYVLANELVQNMGINIANISNLIKEFEQLDYYGDIIKMNNCTFLKKISDRFPGNIKNGLRKYEFTDMSNKLPCRYVQTEYRLSDKNLENSGILLEKRKICGKQFYIFTNDFVKRVKNKIGYTLNKTETNTAIKNGDIDGSLQISKNKFLTWYSLTS